MSCNKLCARCIHDCKQSAKVEILMCKKCTIPKEKKEVMHEEAI